jgi:hypothetical protein
MAQRQARPAEVMIGDLVDAWARPTRSSGHAHGVSAEAPEYPNGVQAAATAELRALRECREIADPGGLDDRLRPGARRDQ